MGRGRRIISNSNSLQTFAAAQTSLYQERKQEIARPYVQALKASMNKDLKSLCSGLSRKEAAELKEKYDLVYKRLSEADSFYHIAPTSERSRISAYGLQPSVPSHNSRWGKGKLDHQPLGVYLMSSEDDIDIIKGLLKEDNDVWKVPAENIKNLQPDWEIINTFSTPRVAAICPDSLNAEMFQRYEDSISDGAWKVVSKQPYLNLKDRKNLKEELKAGEEYLTNLEQ